jgi:hypothetical protein
MSHEDRKRFPCGGPNRSDSIEEPSPEEKEDVIIPLIVETRPLSVERQQTSVWRCLGDQCKKFTSVFSRHRSRKVHPTGGKRKTYKKQKNEYIILSYDIFYLETKNSFIVLTPFC